MSAKVSIIVPVYNVEQYVNRFIDSVINQSYSFWDMVLVDDGSTDGSGQICDEYASNYKNIHVIHQSNQGISAARNAGLESAGESDYVLFVDSDDWLDSNMLEEKITNGNGADLVACDVFDYYKNDEKEYYSPRNTWAGEEPFCADKYYDIICKTGTIWNKLIKRDIIGDVRFDAGMTYGEDTDFLSRILPNIDRSIVIPKPLYYYYRNRQGNVISSSLSERTIEFLNNALVIYKELANQGYSSCGVFRVRLAVNEVFNKIGSIKDDKEYIRACGSALRKTSLSDRLEYIKDKHNRISFRGAVLFFMLCYCPVLGYSAMKKKGYI